MTHSADDVAFSVILVPSANVVTYLLTYLLTYLCRLDNMAVTLCFSL